MITSEPTSARTASRTNTRVAPLIDAHGRAMDYLRISVTPACNFKCVYCRPADDGNDTTGLLSLDEITRVAAAAATLGFTKLRLTGGEPLVRPGVVDLVHQLSSIAGIDHVAITTNASLLGRYAADLKRAGLGGVNISLDTLDRTRAAEVARQDVLPSILEGIDAAYAAGLGPIKFNAVVLRGTNDDELIELVRFASARGAEMRFIEYMPMGLSDSHTLDAQAVFSTADMRRELAKAFDLHPLPSEDPAQPSRGWQCRTTGARVGFISSMTEHFCSTCSRMRLTAEGALRPCLHQDAEVSLLGALHDPAELIARFHEAAALKWKGHQMSAFVPIYAKRKMVSIGG